VSDLSQAIRNTLLTGDPRAKVMATRRLVRDWRAGKLVHRFSAQMPERPSWGLSGIPCVGGHNG